VLENALLFVERRCQHQIKHRHQVAFLVGLGVYLVEGRLQQQLLELLELVKKLRCDLWEPQLLQFSLDQPLWQQQAVQLLHQEQLPGRLYSH
jgi:hypothetical protein